MPRLQILPFADPHLGLPDTSSGAFGYGIQLDLSELVAAALGGPLPASQCRYIARCGLFQPHTILHQHVAEGMTLGGSSLVDIAMRDVRYLLYRSTTNPSDFEFRATSVLVLEGEVVLRELPQLMHPDSTQPLGAEIIITDSVPAKYVSVGWELLRPYFDFAWLFQQQSSRHHGAAELVVKAAMHGKVCHPPGGIGAAMAGAPAGGGP